MDAAPLFPAAHGWREALAGALLLFGASVALLTEALSPFHLLSRGPLALSWILLCLVALAAWVHGPRAVKPEWPGAIDALLIAGIAAVVWVVAFTAVLSPPNSADAMAYHMPRVVYWAQAASVRFLPTPYYNQVMLQPLAEYIMLHTYVLSGGDHFVNLVQCLGSLGSIVGISLVAQAMGAGRRGQAIAALFCATLPNGILQASGAKNDYLAACWLVLMVWYALRFRESGDRTDAVGMGLALALALFTKATAYLFAPPLLAAVFAPVAWRERARLLRAAAAAIACILLINGPQYWRNLALSGSPLGFDSAQGNGVYRWRNERLGVRPALSNLLRNLSDQLGARSPAWNQGVYQVVVGVHGWLGIDPDDRDTTWPGARYAPPRNANHEANAANRWHLLLLGLAAFPLAWLAWRGKQRRWTWYYGGLLGGFLLFCLYLKWQPFLARLELPLFVLGSPIAGWLLERLRPQLLSVAICLFFLNNARPYLFENWTRPLEGPKSLLRTPRAGNYFNDMVQWNNRASYLEAVERTLRSGCEEVGIDISENQLEYPYQALLLEADPRIRFVHTGVSPRPPRPCVVLCLDCEKNEDKIKLYRSTGEPVAIGRFLLFISPGKGPAAGLPH